MSLLKSFSFGSSMGVDELPIEVINLFSDCVGKEKELNYASEIVYSALNGRIDYNRPFNIDAYENAIKKYSSLAQYSRKKKEKFIDFTANSDDSYSECVRAGGIPEEKLDVSGVKDAYLEFDDNDELMHAVANIKKLNTEFIIVEELDIIESIRLALRGIPQAVEDLKHLCDFYPKVSEYIKTILSSGFEFEEIFA